MTLIWAVSAQISAAGKAPFVAAVETREDGRPLKAQFRRVRDFTQAALKGYAKAGVAPFSHVISDGLNCFWVFDEPHYTHERIVSGGGRASAKNPAFNGVNTMLGNIKNAIVGHLHAVGHTHLSRYLAEYEYRFNRRVRSAGYDRALHVGGVAYRAPASPGC